YSTILQYMLNGYHLFSSFLFNDAATTEIYTLSLHDALPICHEDVVGICDAYRNTSTRAPSKVASDARKVPTGFVYLMKSVGTFRDRKSTRLNSSHDQISYAVFCLKKKTKQH